MSSYAQAAIRPLLCVLALLGGAGPATAAPFADLSPPPVTTFKVYRAIDSRLLNGAFGSAGTLLGNTNAGSAGGVLGYLHAEVIPPFASSNGGRRLKDIDAIAVFEVNVLNVRRARLVAPSGSTTGVGLFGPFMSFNGGVATPPNAPNQLLDYGAYVGIQNQSGNPRHAYTADWYSFVGNCPLTPFGTGEGGRRDKPSPCPTTPSLDGICPPATAKPDGSPLCQYTYKYLGYVRLDDLVGITSASQPLCRADAAKRPCADYADFRRDGNVEYSGGTEHAMACAEPQSPESGLAFWSGRCDPSRGLARERALVNWKSLVR